ncbi:MAG: hypothetical protein JWQ98_2937 [Chlorobi bacterium]|nr:hypothetical protein [Chlorobiota bacterium]
MIHLVSALIIGSVYGGGYAARGKELPIYRLSIALLVLMLAIAGSAFLFENQLYGLIGGQWGTFLFARNIAVYALWLQSLICTVLSIVALKTRWHWKYIALGVMFCVLFIALAYATSNATSMAMAG